ncbi:hypothetical protein LPJ64_001791 [Coemansia asiatica]|uniref:tRNA pseudouridine(55) synthase n=1 Tax=Coemansia asiatica TaxID=1052880 RepID=A0A9W8CJM5_9FUNG|nr:hypothetical protein LPJ64_001791 [Coemansia asiatica]
MSNANTHVNVVTESLDNIQRIKAVAPGLHANGACALCILRATQVPIGPAYLQPQADIHRALEIDTSVASTASACSLCLSILSPDIFDQITLKYKEQAFDSSTVCISVELPKSIYIRQRSMQIYVKSAVIDLKDVIKYISGNRIAEACDVAIDGDSDMRIECAFRHEETLLDHQFLVDREGSSIKIKSFRKKGIDYTTGDSLGAVLAELSKCDDSVVASKFGSPPPLVKTAAEIESLVFRRASLFIGGRYLKLQRNISQTPFVVDGKRMTELSVSEVIGEPIKELALCDSYNLVGSGREDADVRMLGDGRPFYIECINPRKTNISQDLISQIEDQLIQENSPVQCRLLQIIKPEDTRIIKEGEENKTKHYCALVWFASVLSKETLEEINQVGSSEIVLQQNTPIRVLHRRSPLVRPRKLLRLEITHIEGHFYKVRIESEAGTYIKEFVHGDLGRTSPSLSSLAGGIVADILELDVENVSLDFPPKSV